MINNKGNKMSEETIKPGEVITVYAPAPVKNEITFCPQPGEWVMKITREGIKFNEERYPGVSPDGFAQAVIDILERSFAVKFSPKYLKKEEDIFYYHGKYFKTEPEFWAYVNEFKVRQTTEEDFNSLFDMLKKDIWENIRIREIKITNAQVDSIISEVFLLSLQRIFDVHKGKK